MGARKPFADREVTDADLLARIHAGDTASFDHLVIRYQPLLYRTALAMVRCPADAEDVTQATWLRAYRGVHTFRGAATLTTWLIAIFRHQAIDHQRIARRRLRREAEFSRADRLHGECLCRLPSPEALVLGDERSIGPLEELHELHLVSRYGWQRVVSDKGATVF